MSKNRNKDKKYKVCLNYIDISGIEETIKSRNVKEIIRYAILRAEVKNIKKKMKGN